MLVDAGLLCLYLAYLYIKASVQQDLELKEIEQGDSDAGH